MIKYVKDWEEYALCMVKKGEQVMVVMVAGDESNFFRTSPVR